MKKILLALGILAFGSVAQATPLVNNSATGQTSEDSITVAIRVLDSLGSPTSADTFYIAVFGGGKTNATVWDTVGTTSLAGIDTVVIGGVTYYYFSRLTSEIDGSGADGYYSGFITAVSNAPISVSTMTPFDFQVVGNDLTAGYLANIDTANMVTLRDIVDSTVDSLGLEYGTGTWTTATGFAVAGDAMALTQAERDTVSGITRDSTVATLNISHGLGNWTSATGFSVAGDKMGLTPAAIAGIADTVTDSMTNTAVASVTGAVGSVTGAVTVGTNNDKAGYSLSTAGIDAIQEYDTSLIAAGIGQMLKDTSAYQGAGATGLDSATTHRIVQRAVFGIDTLGVIGSSVLSGASDSVLGGVVDTSGWGFWFMPSTMPTMAEIDSSHWNYDSSLSVVAGSMGEMLKDTAAYQGAASGLTATDIWNVAFGTAFTAGSMGDSLNNSSYVQGAGGGGGLDTLATTFVDRLVGRVADTTWKRRFDSAASLVAGSYVDSLLSILRFTDTLNYTTDSALAGLVTDSVWLSAFAARDSVVGSFGDSAKGWGAVSASSLTNTSIAGAVMDSLALGTKDLKLKSVVVSNSTGDAVQFTSTGVNGDGLQLTGNGSGEGLKVTGGSTSGHGAQIVGGGSGDGLNIAAGLTGGAALRAAGVGGSADAIVLQPDAGGAAINADIDSAAFDATFYHAIALAADSLRLDSMLSFLKDSIIDSTEFSRFIGRKIWGIPFGSGSDSTTAAQRVVAGGGGGGSDTTAIVVAMKNNFGDGSYIGISGNAGSGTNAVVIGAVDTSGTDSLVSNVGITVKTLAGLTVGAQTTASDGYTTWNLDPDTFIVRAGGLQGDHFWPSSWDSIIVVTDPNSFTVGGYDLNIVGSGNPAKCVIWGIVLDAQGVAVQGANVSAELRGFNLIDTSNHTIIMPTLVDTMTNDTGYFQMEVVRTSVFSRGGRYNIRITKDGNRIASIPAYVVPDSASNRILWNNR